MLYQGCLSGVDEDSNFIGQDTMLNYKEGEGSQLIGNADGCIYVCVCICVFVCVIRVFCSTYYMLVRA